jgi:Spondin_N
MMRRVRVVLSLVALGVAVACGGGDPSPGSPTAVVPAPAPVPTPTAPKARYEVTFESTWRRETHPADFPADPHFSRLIGGTHSSRVRFWMAGRPASPGIRAMAEQGRTSPLDVEVQAAIAAGTAYSLIQGGAIDRSPGVATAEFEIGRDHPLVSLVTMVAPSPDWFVGTDSLSLVEGGDWVAETSVTLYPWDAGTDSGATYASPDLATQPRQEIHALEGHPVALGGVVAPFASFSFRRVQ